MRRALCLFLLLSSRAEGASIAEAVEAAAATPPFQRAIWFVLVEQEDGSVLYARNDATLAITASVRKLFSAAAVADCLDPQSVLRTELWREGEDLVLRGDGDPSFGSPRFGFEELAFAPFVDALQQRRVRRVRDLIADVSLFDRVTIPYQWKVGNLTSDVAAVVDALAYRENELRDQAVPSPPLFALQVFRERLREAGIEVTGALRMNIHPRPWSEPLAVVESPALIELLEVVLQNSLNIAAEMLFKRISACPGCEPPASYRRSLEMERSFLSRIGIEEDAFRFVDGSGLAPDDLATPSAIVSMVRWMDRPVRRALWWEMLSAPGGPGSLRNRLKELAERVRGKTGTTAGVNSLAGIMVMPDGSRRYFAILVNHHTGSSGEANRLIDSIVAAIGS